MRHYHKELIPKNFLPLQRPESEWIGQQYGTSIVVGKIEDSNIPNSSGYARDRLILLCSCGEKFIVNALTLNRKRKSGTGVGCSFCRSSQKASNLLGVEINNMVCDEISRKRDNQNRSKKIALVRCKDCNFSKSVCLSTFRLGQISCQKCFPTGKGSQKIYKLTRISPNRYFSVLKVGAKKRGIKVCVTMNEILRLLESQNGECSLSGLPISLFDGNASLDRIDSFGDYTLDNIQWVHRAINFMKSSISQQEFIALCSAVHVKQSST